jgi:hypothetical protein
MEKALSEQERLTAVRARLEKSRVVDMFFPSITGKELDYVDNMLDILEKNQDWIDGNAGKKAEQYEQMQEVLRTIRSVKGILNHIPFDKPFAGNRFNIETANIQEFLFLSVDCLMSHSP